MIRQHRRPKERRYPNCLNLIITKAQHSLTHCLIIEANTPPICHVRVMKSAAAYPALGASLNVSGANLGIALGSLLGGRVIHIQGLASVGGAATGVILIAVGLTLILQLTTPSSLHSK